MRALMFLVTAMAVVGCGMSRPPAPRQSEAMERSARMLRQLDKLEADLHAEDAQTGVYAELVERHGHAQEIACKVSDEHVQEIHRLDLAMQQKIEQKRQDRLRKKKAVAQLPSRRSRS